jgi:hypothetical protein
VSAVWSPFNATFDSAILGSELPTQFSATGSTEFTTIESAHWVTFKATKRATQCSALRAAVGDSFFTTH